MPASVQHIKGDIKNLAEFKMEFEAISPDVVLHMILSNEQEAIDAVEVFNGISPRIVAISSQDVYRAFALVRKFEMGAFEPMPITEKSALRNKHYLYQDPSKDRNDWCNTYDKILVERIIMGNSDISGTVLRLPAVYGPKDNQHRFVSYLHLKRMFDKRPYIVMDEFFSEWRWTHGYVENVAHAIVLAVTDARSAGRIYNVGSPRDITMYEFVSDIGKQIGWNGEIVVLPKSQIPSYLEFPLDTKQHLVVDSTLIQKELGYNEIISFEEGLRRTVEWEINNIHERLHPKFPKMEYEKEDEFLIKIGLSHGNTASN
jgi:nucleoside-diphosphate-sugar epimerase